MAKEHQATENRRRPTVWQSLNNYIPIIILAFTSWIAVTVVDGKVDRGTITTQLRAVQATQQEVAGNQKKLMIGQEETRDTILQHDLETRLSKERISAIHHNSGVTLCIGCHDYRKKSK